MNDFLIKKADELARRDIAKFKEVKIMPKPRTLTEVAVERLAEKELEKIAPKTGYPDLDEIIKGWVPGHLYTITGVPNVGKTSLACNFTDRIRRQGKRILYFALEPENLVVDYLASVRLDKKFGELVPEDIEFDDGFIHIYGKQEVPTIQDMVEIVRDSDRYDMIFIDHIGYFVKGEKDTYQEQNNVLKVLAGLAKEKGLAIGIIAHMNKNAQNQKADYIPSMADISGSGAFGQDSTEVLIVTRQPKSEDPTGLQYGTEGRLYVVKTKAGPNGYIDLKFSERKANIVSIGELYKFEQDKIPVQQVIYNEDEWPSDRDL